jgi:hypothetical protein
MILTRPDNLKPEHRDVLIRITGVCPEMTQLVTGVRDFAGLLTPCAENTERFSHWSDQVHAADLSHLHAFTRGLGRDHNAVNAALILPSW